MVRAFRPDCFATSRKLTPRGVPAMGEGRALGAGRAGALYSGREFCCPMVCCGGRARASTSSKERTNAVADNERRNPRRLLIKRLRLPRVLSEYREWRGRRTITGERQEIVSRGPQPSGVRERRRRRLPAV